MPAARFCIIALQELTQIREAAEKLQKLKPVPLPNLVEKCSKNDGLELTVEPEPVEPGLCALAKLQAKPGPTNVDQRKFFFQTMKTIFSGSNRWKAKKKMENLMPQVCDYQLYLLQQMFRELKMKDAPEVRGCSRPEYIWDCLRQVNKIKDDKDRDHVLAKVIADYLKFGLNETGRKDRDSFVKKNKQVLQLEDQKLEPKNASSSSSAPPGATPISEKNKEALVKVQEWKERVASMKRKVEEKKQAEEMKFKKKKTNV